MPETVIKTVVKPRPPAPPEPPAVPNPVSPDAEAVQPIDPDRPPVVADGPEFIVVSHALGRFCRGDQIRRSHLPAAADLRRLFDLNALAPLPGVDVDAILNPPAPAPATDPAPADKPPKGK